MVDRGSRFGKAGLPPVDLPVRPIARLRVPPHSVGGVKVSVKGPLVEIKYIHIVNNKNAIFQ